MARCTQPPTSVSIPPPSSRPTSSRKASRWSSWSNDERRQSLVSRQDELARGAIFLRRDAAIAVGVRELAEFIRRRLRFVGLEQDIPVLVMELQRPVHQHPVALEQLL